MKAYWKVSVNENYKKLENITGIAGCCASSTECSHNDAS